MGYFTAYDNTTFVGGKFLYAFLPNEDSGNPEDMELIVGVPSEDHRTLTTWEKQNISDGDTPKEILTSIQFSESIIWNTGNLTKLAGIKLEPWVSAMMSAKMLDRIQELVLVLATNVGDYHGEMSTSRYRDVSSS